MNLQKRFAKSGAAVLLATILLTILCAPASAGSLNDYFNGGKGGQTTSGGSSSSSGGSGTIDRGSGSSSPGKGNGGNSGSGSSSSGSSGSSGGSSSSGSSSNTGKDFVSKYDKEYLNDEQYKDVLAAKAEYDEAERRGDTAGMQAAHDKAEAARAEAAGGGYSGGGHGADYIPFPGGGSSGSSSSGGGSSGGGGSSSGGSSSGGGNSSDPNRLHTITTIAGPGGMITPSGVTEMQTIYTSYEVRVRAYDGYVVENVIVDGVSRGPDYTQFTVGIKKDVVVQAIFAAEGHTIRANAGLNGSISPAGTTGVAHGGSKTYTITPNKNYTVDYVEVDGVSIGAQSSYTFSNVQTDHTIVAIFKIGSHTITASAGAHGKISPAGAATVQDGATQAYTITPDTHYAIEDVKVDGASIGAKSSYTFSDVRADHTVSATFKPIKYTITASAGAHGSISPAGARSVQSGTSQSYTITPVYGYGVADVKVDGVSVGARSSYTFANITGNHTISATFKTEGKVDVGDMALTDQDGKPFTTFKAGYGFEASLSVNMQFATITSASAKMSNGQTCQMELVGGKLVFVKNSASPTNARKYYVPVTTKDGTFSVTFTIKAVDAAGVALPNVTKTFTFKINGSMYDDDHTAPGK